MSLYAEWFDTPLGPVIVTHEGRIKLGEFSEQELMPSEAKFVAAAFAFAARSAERLIRHA